MAQRKCSSSKMHVIHIKALLKIGIDWANKIERLHFHFLLSCVGEGNGNSLQCSCLENPRDGGAWWLPSMGSPRVGHDWSDLAVAVAKIGMQCRRTVFFYIKLQVHKTWYWIIAFENFIISSQFRFSSVQLLSHVWLCDPMDCSTPDFPVLHHLLELAQTPIHWVNDAIQPSHPLSSPSPLAFHLSQNQCLFQWVSSSHQVSKVLEFQLQHQSFQWLFRTDFL